MPNPGQVNNASGANGFTQAGGGESPYGAVKRLQQTTSAVPLPTAPGATAPDRAQRSATTTQAPLPGPAESFAATPVPYPAQIAAVWQQVAATPGASPLVQMYAARANGS